MDDLYKVCGNCGHCTMIDGGFICIDPDKPEQVRVSMGDRRPCFVVSPLTPEQTIAVTLAPCASSTMQ